MTEQAVPQPQEWMKKAADKCYELFDEWLRQLLSMQRANLCAEELKPKLAQIIAGEAAAPQDTPTERGKNDVKF
jgi:hypothetical protein